jgi:hypothetical protein
MSNEQVEFMNPGEFTSASSFHDLMLQYGDPHCMRPYIGRNGKSYITAPVFNAAGHREYKEQVIHNAAVLRQNDWKMIDEAVVVAARPRLRFFGDLIDAGLQVNIPNALSKTTWQYERQSSISPATISIDGLRRSDGDRPNYDMAQMPLPLITKDFSFSARQIMVSRSSNMPIDTTTASLAAGMVAEQVEKLALGVLPQYNFGGNLYGVCNHPNRITKLFSNPRFTNGQRDPAWYPSKLNQEILDARLALNQAHFYGPYALYHSPDFDEVLDDDYSITFNGLSNSLTLRERLLKNDTIKSVRSCEFLPAGTLFLIAMTASTIEAVNGLDIATVQWQTEGGFEIHFKVLCMMLPRIKADYYGNTGILHGTLTPAATAP